MQIVDYGQDLDHGQRERAGNGMFPYQRTFDKDIEA